MGLKKRMDGVQMLQNKEQQKRVELNIMEDQLKEGNKTRKGLVARSKKEFDRSARTLKRSVMKCQAVSSSIPNLVMQVNDLKHSFEHHKRDTEKARDTVAKLKSDVGMLENAFMNKKDFNGVCGYDIAHISDVLYAWSSSPIYIYIYIYICMHAK